ncbi:SMI1/KNR4 family protein [Ornithinimicrobium sp. Y1847]|uniref:SMI1/KNR4 family protein n=1 Tax=Ornithinimicrobium sp. Y1847 TaxID=3405419 RepID=UPI003B67E089
MDDSTRPAQAGSDVDAVWDRIEAAFEAAGLADDLQPGASPEAIAEVEEHLGVKMPEDLRASLARHDGCYDSWPTGSLLGTRGIRSEADVWNELLADGTFDASAEHDAGGGSGAVGQGWWRRGWIPLDADGAGNGAVVDTDPGPQGQVGQVLDMDHEVGPSGPKHDSVLAYLRDLAEQLESGALTWTGGDWERG